MPRKTICLTISKGLPAGFAINRGIIYKESYQHVIRGFLIEGSSWKGTYRLHDFTFALFRTHKFIHLTDCRELQNTKQPAGWHEGDDDTVVADALQTIHAAGILPDLLNGCSPAQYLERFAVPDLDEADPTTAFDLGCAAGLCGDLTFARRGLEAARHSRVDYARLYGPYTDHEVFLQQVADHLAALEQGVDAFRSFQRQATTEAAAAHGFCPPSFGDARDCRA